MPPKAACVISLGLLLFELQPRLAFAQDKPLQVSEQDLRSAATRSVEPEYPAVARQIRLTGEVEIEVFVALDGDVEKVSVLRGNTLLIGSTVQAVRKWRFQAFRVSGQPSRAVGTMRFSFQL